MPQLNYTRTKSKTIKLKTTSSGSTVSPDTTKNIKHTKQKRQTIQRIMTKQQGTGGWGTNFCRVKAKGERPYLLTQKVNFRTSTSASKSRKTNGCERTTAHNTCEPETSSGEERTFAGSKQRGSGLLERKGQVSVSTLASRAQSSRRGV